MRISKVVKIGNIQIGGGNPVAVQSMTNTDTADREKTLRQIKRLEKAGCEIVRFTVNTLDAAKNIAYFKERTSVPLVADIHFDYKLALESAAAGIDKIRINPGNIGSADRIKKVCDSCRLRGIPIRVGVNGGSLEKELLAKYGGATPQAIADSAAKACRALERFDFEDIVVSVKSSDVRTMIAANRLIAAQCDYPLHLGVTEAGGGEQAVVKSSAGIGALLAEGIGDTLRVSLTDDVVKEVKAGYELLYALDLRPHIELVSCPTCGRTKFDLIHVYRKLYIELAKIKTNKTIKVALMGCPVNGPGEAASADIGIAGGKGEGTLFFKGVPVRTVPQDKMIEVLLEEVRKMVL
ncbi:MAG: flavodoxin-dependent (E)-4-hydroxy-3-methylbut-2-enyl-diphosphate synthase [Clostridia bacterium]|nr:flavodoxin-dependent (E)-4-hydroxy-3-methylbut-2-enyl-diphosphate synthase [Clostridia bacterium]